MSDNVDDEARVLAEGKEEKPLIDSRTADPNGSYSVRVKPEYILNHRPESLPPLNGSTTTASSNHEPQSSKRKKKRARGDIKSTDGFCLTVLRGERCDHGEKCRYSHDMKSLLANREEDIVVDGGCPHFNLYGICPYGLSCRLGQTHINMATGENIHQTPTMSPPPPVENVLQRDVQTQLRKKTYPFKCKRYNEKSGSRSSTEVQQREEVIEQSTNTTSNSPTHSSMPSNTGKSTDMTPLPDRCKKLIDFSNKVYVAPLTTVGNLPFRRIMKRFGADITCGEMALAVNLLGGQPSEWALLKRHPVEDVFGVQIAAGYPDLFIRSCELIEAHTRVDFVDLNLGCPLDIICDKGAGSALMMRTKRLREALEGIVNTLSCPVTVKMRTGWDTSKPFAHELVPKIQSWGLDGIGAVMIHGRSRLQRYSKQSDWDYIAQVAKSQDPLLPRIPVIGNGDILSFTDYEEKVLREGVSSCAMLARGALIKPWLPTEIKERRHWDISATERLDILKEFVRFGLEHWGSDQKGVNNCRRFLLEWLSFLHRYVPVGLLEVIPQQMNQRPPAHMSGRNDLETLFLSPESSDWIRISELLLGPVPDGFQFEPKHKAKG